MPNVGDLGKLYKEEFPGDYDMSDEDIGRMVKARYPDNEFYQTFTDTKMVRFESIPRNLQPRGLQDPNFERKLLQLWKRFDPQMGGITSAWRHWVTGGQNKFLEESNKQVIHLLAQVNAIAEAVVKQEQNERELELFYHENQATIQRLKDATDNGLALESYDTVQTQHYLSEQRMRELEHARRLEFEEFRKTNKHESDLRMREAAQQFFLQMQDREHALRMDILRMEAEARIDNQRTNDALSNAERRLMQSNALVNKLKDNLTAAVFYRDSLYDMDINENSRKYLIKRENAYIKSLERQIDERSDRLV